MNSMTSSVIALVVVFMLALVILSATKMKFVLKDPDATKKEIAWDKLMAYSGLFAVIVAIVVLLVMEAMGKGKGSVSTRGGMSPSFRYCGDMN